MPALAERYWSRLPGDTVWKKTPYLTPSDLDPAYEYVVLGTKAIDILGQEVQVGDRIATALTVSRSAEMAVGRVVAFKPRKDSYSYPPREDLLSIEVEWESRSYTRVERSKLDASLPKYLKL